MKEESLLISFLAPEEVLFYFHRRSKKMKKQITLKIARIAIFSAFSFTLYMLKFNLPFLFPSFLEIQFSTLPAIVIGLLFGPVEGLIVIVVRMFLKLPLTHTIGVGEIADLVIGLSTVLTSSLIYKYNHTKKGGRIALIFGTLIWVGVAVVANWLFILPFYMELAGLDNVLKMLMIIPGINETNYMSKYLLYAVLPFNLILASLTSIITYFIYKRISLFFKSEC